MVLEQSHPELQVGGIGIREDDAREQGLEREGGGQGGQAVKLGRLDVTLM